MKVVSTTYGFLLSVYSGVDSPLLMTSWRSNRVYFYRYSLFGIIWYYAMNTCIGWAKLQGLWTFVFFLGHYLPCDSFFHAHGLLRIDRLAMGHADQCCRLLRFPGGCCTLFYRTGSAPEPTPFGWWVDAYCDEHKPCWNPLSRNWSSETKKRLKKKVCSHNVNRASTSQTETIRPFGCVFPQFSPCVLNTWYFMIRSGQFPYII